MIAPELLRSFVAVAETRNFSHAARRLGLGQSTLSQHILRLEEKLGKRLLARDTHSVAPTADGDALLPLARQALESQESIRRFAAGIARRGRLRLGVSEDFAGAGLADVLRRFAQDNPAVDVELTIGLSALLYDRFDAGTLDVIFAKRRRGDRRGQAIWREQLGWIAHPGLRPDPAAPLPLLLYPPPSITRALALDALQAAGRSWRIACTSGSLSGLYAAAHAGLGVAPHSVRLKPPDLALLPPDENLPELGEIEFVVIGPAPHDAATTALVSAIRARIGEKEERSSFS